MKILDLTQGSPEWHKHRATARNASDAPAMLGFSPYKTRAELLHEKATGIIKDVDAATQKRFDDGHEAEEKARPEIEDMITADLYPVTACSDDDYLSASFDGITMSGDYVWENKLFNQNLDAYIEEHNDLPDSHWPQVEQQLLVSKAPVCIFTLTDISGVIKRKLEYKSKPERARLVLNGWNQFDKDLAEYEPPKHAEKLEAAPVKDLPAITYTMNGLSLSSNLDKFKAQAEELIEQSKLPLVTDQDFADREALNKVFKEAEAKIKLIQDQVLGEIEDVAAFSKELGHVGELLRQARLPSEKLVKARKEEIKLEILNAAKEKVQHHILAVNNTLEGVSLPSFAIDIAGAMKGKKTVQSLHEAAEDEIARAKIEINAMADAIRINLKSFDEIAGQFKFLFADLQQLITRDNDSFVAIVKSRVMEHKEAEAKRIAEEKAREEEAEAKRKKKAEEERQQQELASESREEDPNFNEAITGNTLAQADYHEHAKTVPGELSAFERWWDAIGSGITPRDGDDMEEHAYRVAKYAFDAGQNTPQQSKAA